MLEVALPLATAFLLGALHAFEADHMAAVGAFVVRRPRPREAFGFGLRWAAGHGLTVLVAGTALVALGLTLPESAGSLLERLVGLLLIAIGVWTASGARHLHVHEHRHADGTRHVHLHSHRDEERHTHRHAITAVGALHGLAGTAPVLALLPLARFDSVAGAAAYLSVFAIGTALAMALFAMSAGVVVGTARHSDLIARGIILLTAAATIVIGVFWLVGPH